MNLEVQWTTEPVIAAVERCGGTITARYFDMPCLQAVVNPKKFFSMSLPIPCCRSPPADAMEYYTSAKHRGYLAHPDDIHEERIKLSQKYGYILPDINSDPKKAMLLMKKEYWQIFYGLKPGWMVNLVDCEVLRPKNPEHLKLYSPR